MPPAATRCACLLVTLLLGSAPAGAATGRTFTGAFDAACLSRAQAFVVRDLDRDGHLDVVTPYQVLLGRPGGDFGPPSNLPLPDEYRHDVAAGDVNGDGVEDLAVVSPNLNLVTLLRGRGDGSFDVMADLPTGDYPYSIELADLNRDGRLDMLVTNLGHGHPSVSTRLGRGDGSFGPRSDFSIAAYPYDVHLADLTGDGVLDLIVPRTYYGYLVQVWRGLGDGRFGSPREFDTANWPTGVASADLNEDGLLDMVVACGPPDHPSFPRPRITVLLATGDLAYSRTDYEMDQGSESVVLADFDRDGVIDVATGNRDGGTVSVRSGLGGGAFGPRSDWPAPALAEDIAAEDVNQDGYVDILTVGGCLGVSLNNGDRTFGGPAAVPASGPQRIAAADANHDGLPDLAAAFTDAGQIAVFPGVGDHAFGAPSTYAVTGSPTAIGLADVNGDGHPDLLSGSRYQVSVSVRPGDGSGTFGSPITVPSGYSPSCFAVGDMNNDGLADLVIGYDDQINRSNTFSISLGQGEGAFGPPIKVSGVGATRVLLEDLTGDGVLDVITNGGIVRRGNGDGTVSNVFFGCCAGNDVALGDFDEDGLLDYASNGTGAWMAVAKGLGFGAFAWNLVESSWESSGVEIADVNGDGWADIASAGPQENVVSIHLGRGDGSFEPRQCIGVGSRPEDLLLLDVNGDGLPEIVTADQKSNSVTVLANWSRTPFYTITASAGIGGGVLPHGAIIARAGTRREFRILPDPGQVVSAVFVDGVSVGAPSRYVFEDISSDHTLEAVFECATQVSFEMSPNKLKLGGHLKKKEITAYFEPGPPWSAEAIDVESVRVNGVAPDPLGVAQIGDRDGNGIPDLAVPFQASAFDTVLPAGKEVPLAAEGLIDGACFIGRDTVQVKLKKFHFPAAGDVLAPGQVIEVRYEVGDERLPWAAIACSLDGGASWSAFDDPQENDGSLAWTAPATVADSAWLAVVESDFQAVDAEGAILGELTVSDPFSIGAPTRVIEPARSLDLRIPAVAPGAREAVVVFELPRTLDVALRVIDVSGRVAAVLARGRHDTGRHEARWSVGESASGVYFVLLEAGGRRMSRRLVLIR